MVLFGPPGIGKTSFGAATPKPVFLMDNQEDGIGRLKTARRIPDDIPSLPPVSTWGDVQDALTQLASDPHDFRTLVIDTLGGMERLCHEFVCARDYKNVWGGGSGFTAYGRGYEVSLPDWRGFLNRLDRLRSDRGMSIIALAHSLVKPFKNPEGEDYDRYNADMHQKTWGVTHKWADLIVFANYHVEVEREGLRAKGKGGQLRFMNTEFTAAYDAKNSCGLPPSISMGESGAEAWANLVSEIQAARKAS